MSAPCSEARYFSVPRSTVNAPIFGVALASDVSRDNAQVRLPSGSICRPIWGSNKVIWGRSILPISRGKSLMSNSAALAFTRNGSLAHSGLANSMPSALTVVVLPSLTVSRSVISKRLPSSADTYRLMGPRNKSQGKKNKTRTDTNIRPAKPTRNRFKKTDFKKWVSCIYCLNFPR